MKKYIISIIIVIVLRIFEKTVCVPLYKQLVSEKNGHSLASKKERMQSTKKKNVGATLNPPSPFFPVHKMYHANDYLLFSGVVIPIKFAYIFPIFILYFFICQCLDP